MAHHRFFILLVLVLATAGLRAQNAHFVTSGTIEYEKRLNLYDQMKDWGDDETFSDVMKKAVPKFKIDYYDLSFTPTRILYKPGRDNSENNKMPTWMQEQAGENSIIESDLETGKFIAQKIVLGQTFLLQDSLRKIKWKITDETKTIAGFNCRRANAIVMDSIYVVAFYTEEIIAPGGPESFTGLPGMILGIALPHEHVTWFATKVQLQDVGASSLVAPQKGKKTTYAELLTLLKDRTKDWGKGGRRTVQSTML